MRIAPYAKDAERLSYQALIKTVGWVAVLLPFAPMVPTVEFPPVTPFTYQVTAVLLVPVATAVNCCEAPMATAIGEGATTIATNEVPMPVKFAVCGLSEAVSVKVSVPAREPDAVGEKVTTSAQLPPAAMITHEPVKPKSPVILTLEIPSDVLPLFVKVRVCPALVVPTFWLPNVKLEDEKASLAARIIWTAAGPPQEIKL